MKMEKIQSFPEVRLSTSLPRYLFQEQIFSEERRYLKTRALYGRYDLAFLEWYLVTVLSLVVVEDVVFLSLHKAVRKEPRDSSHLSSPPVVVTHLLTDHPDELQIMGSRLENNVWCVCENYMDGEYYWAYTILTSYLSLLQADLIVFLSIVAKQNSVFLLTWVDVSSFMEDYE